MIQCRYGFCGRVAIDGGMADAAGHVLGGLPSTWSKNALSRPIRPMTNREKKRFSRSRQRQVLKRLSRNTSRSGRGREMKMSSIVRRECTRGSSRVRKMRK
jgi:hypothetical protein